MPDKNIVVLPAASRDIDSATDHYYEEGSEALASRWTRDVETALRHIASFAATGSPRYAAVLGIAQLRVWPVKRFPYLIFYFDRTASVDIVRVLHERRDLPATLQTAESEAGADK